MSPDPYREADALAFIRDEVLPGQLKLAIALDGAVVGGIGMGVNAHQYKGTIGYWMAARSRGCGVCTRALRLVMHALEDRELQRVDVTTDPENVASQRVAEKVGFRREGVLRAHLRHPDGRVRDSVMFSLLLGERVDRSPVHVRCRRARTRPARGHRPSHVSPLCRSAERIPLPRDL